MPAHAQPQRVPTIDDLRVKLCYICREEEYFDKPANPPVLWVHPCKCTLVAHEACLLNWIKSAQSDASRAGNALKCPQCSAVYEILSVRPLGLRLLDQLNSSLSVAAKFVTASSLAAIVLACGSGFYMIMTSYGLFAVREFIGEAMYGALLTDDITQWPWHAFLNLPMIPITLLASQTRFFSVVPIFPLFLAWTSSPPTATVGGTFRLSTANIAAYPMQPLIRWPPSPIMVTILFPFIRGMYSKGMRALRTWALGPQHADLALIRRIEWALLGGGEAAQLRVEIDEDGGDGDGRQRQRRREQRQGGAAARRNGNANANANADANANRGDQAEDELDDVAVAEQTIRVNGASIGRFIGSALMLPTVAKYTGNLLLHLSRHSSWLKAFLAVRPYARPTAAFPRSWFQDTGRPMGVGQLGMSLRVVFNLICGGTKTWAEADPVWWRNTVGLGIFIMARDCLNLWHVYLTKRQLETRHIRNRTFAGVDIKSLDLIPSKPTPPPATADHNGAAAHTELDAQAASSAHISAPAAVDQADEAHRP